MGKYDDYDTAEKINNKADELFNDSKKDELRALAQEKGIDESMVEMYLEGEIPAICDELTVAVGKLDVEAKMLNINGVLDDWKNVIESMCMEDANMQQAVMNKDKQMVECMALLLGFAFNNKVKIDDKIVNATEIEHNGKKEKMHGPVYLGIPNKRQVMKIVKGYYLGEES